MPPPPEQICVEVRLPPLKPKEAAWPKRLAAGMGLLFAAPGGEGAVVMQWWLHSGSGAAADDEAGPCFTLPVGTEGHSSQEDGDSAPAVSVQLPLMVADLPAVRCMLLDDLGHSLWTGTCLLVEQQ